jgi:EmrB/QacA subfamily drug resistance transporter
MRGTDRLHSLALVSKVLDQSAMLVAQAERPQTTGAGDREGPARERTRRGTALAVLCVSILIVNLDNTILNVALPTLVRKLGATSSELQWIVDAYSMVFAGLLLVGGSVADRFGRKRVFLLGLTIFGCGSVGAAFSGSVGMLIGWRAVMGSGAALTMPATLSLINDLFPDPGERSRAIGLWAGMSGIGIAIGPIAGGLLLAHFWWGSVFLVNVPIILGGLLGAVLLVPESRNPHAARPDPGGALLSILALGCILWAIIEAPTHGWTSTDVLGVGLTGIAILAVFLVWELRCEHPMLNLNFFRARRFSAAAAAVSLGAFALFGALFVQTQFLQFDLRLSPLQAGVRILPLAATIALAAPFSSLVVRYLGSKVPASIGLLAIAGGLCEASLVSGPATTYAQMLPGLLLTGLGAGLLLPTATDAVIGSVPRSDSGVGSATNGVSIQFGGALGVAVIGSVLSSRYEHQMTRALAAIPIPRAAEQAALGSIGGALDVAAKLPAAAGAQLVQHAGPAFMSGLGGGLGIGAVVALAGMLIAAVALPSRPAPQLEARQSPAGELSEEAEDGQREERSVLPSAP